jgi:DNA-binding MltR family transcriptional regulator
MSNLDKPYYIRFLNEMDQESDRGVAVIGAAIIDDYMEQLITAFLVSNREIGSFLSYNGPLGTAGARKNALFYLGLITEKERYDVGHIQKIRNSFAHEAFDLTFIDNKITNWCNELNAPKIFHSIMERDDVINTSRGQFIFTAALLAGRFNSRIKMAIEQQRTPLADSLY